MSDNLKDLSRRVWSTTSKSGADINTSCFMRIADAIEGLAASSAKIAQDRVQLEKEVAMYKQMYRDTKARMERIERSRNSYKGLVTRLQRQVAELKDELKGGDQFLQGGETNGYAD